MSLVEEVLTDLDGLFASESLCDSVSHLLNVVCSCVLLSLDELLAHLFEPGKDVVLLELLDLGGKRLLPDSTLSEGVLESCMLCLGLTFQLLCLSFLELLELVDVLTLLVCV